MVHGQFVDGGIARQVRFMNTAIRSQEIPQTCPPAFVGVDMDFSNAVSIVIACIFTLSMTDCAAYALQAIVALIFISIEGRFRLSKPLDKWTQAIAFGIRHHLYSHLSRFAPNHCANRRSIIRICTSTTSFIGSFSRWILWISVPVSFFPLRSGTFRRFRLPDRSKVWSLVPSQHSLAGYA